ncbi:MAG: peptidoglycan-binding domain-containing protein [Paracoccaceae bacterium]
MLPSVKKTAITAITALSLALTAVSPAQALGKNERKFLEGVAAALLVQALIKETRKKAPVQQYVQPQYVQPAPVYPRHVVQSNYTPANSIYRTPAAVAFNAYSAEERRAIQRRLARMGYYRSGIDGSFGPGTYNAVAAYARDSGTGDRLADREGAFGIYDGLIY